MTYRDWNRAASKTNYKRRWETSQQALTRALHENRVRNECLEIAIGALRDYSKEFSGWTAFAKIAEKVLYDIEQRLAELGPEDPCEGCGNQGSTALFGDNPATGNALCWACNGYKEKAQLETEEEAG